MKEIYIKKIIEKMKESGVALGVASAMVFEEEQHRPDFLRADFDEAEAKFKEYAPQIIAEDAKNGLESFRLDKFIEELKKEERKGE